MRICKAVHCCSCRSVWCGGVCKWVLWIIWGVKTRIQNRNQSMVVHCMLCIPPPFFCINTLLKIFLESSAIYLPVYQKDKCNSLIIIYFLCSSLLDSWLYYICICINKSFNKTSRGRHILHYLQKLKIYFWFVGLVVQRNFGSLLRKAEMFRRSVQLL